MRETDIKKQLNMLKNLMPDEGFAKSSRMKILYDREPVQSRFFNVSQSLSTALSMGLIVMFVVFIALGGVATFLRGSAFPTFEGVNEESLHVEAGVITETIQVRLEEVDYLEEVEKSSLAQAPERQRANQEAFTEQATSTDEEIDNLLNEARDY